MTKCPTAVSVPFKAHTGGRCRKDCGWRVMPGQLVLLGPGGWGYQHEECPPC